MLEKIIVLALKQTYCLTIHFRNLFLWCLFNFPNFHRCSFWCHQQSSSSYYYTKSFDAGYWAVHYVSRRNWNGKLAWVKEIRSISKFGLSVVTIVFEDDLGTYLPRQLIAEKSNQHLKKSHLVLELHKWVSLQGLRNLPIHTRS
jgi:hypothetical protein